MTGVAFDMALIIITVTILNNEVRSAGTLQLTLKRYKNDTCGGYQDEADKCVYFIDFITETSYWRGGTPVIAKREYQLGNARSVAGKIKEGDFYFQVQENEIIFEDQTAGSVVPVLGSLTNPIPIPTLMGNVSVTFSVSNTIEDIFYKTYSFDTGSMKPWISEQLSDVMSSGFVILRYELQCEEHYKGLGCQKCSSDWYSNKCDVYCIESERYNCNNQTGSKVCKENYYGKDCDVFCQSNKNYTCSDFGIRICSDHHIGHYCSSDTSCEAYQDSTCEVECIPSRGKFLCNGLGMLWCEGPSEVCRECIPSQETVLCTTCTPHPPQYSCSETGRRVCGERWTGDQCNQCQDMWYGEQCQVYCNASSSQYTCSQIGDRKCVGNWGSKNCDSCQDDYYSSDCKVYCAPSSNHLWKCHKSTGAKVCSKTRTGENCTRCIDNHYPRGKVADNVNCKLCVESDRNTCSNYGDFICKPSWYGKQCDQQCIDNGKYTCVPSDEGVIFSCNGNFSGTDCLSCKKDHYGKNCSIYCLSDKKVHCDAYGIHVCRKNYYSPPTCRVYCNNISAEYVCLTDGTKQCNGNRNISTDCSTCTSTYYGESCNIHCKTQSPHSQCNSSGFLICEERWAGENCELCAENWHGESCIGDICHKSCDVWCQDLTNYKCDREGVLEITTEYAKHNTKFIDDTEYIGIMFGVVTAWFITYTVLSYFIIKTANFWCPIEDKK